MTRSSPGQERNIKLIVAYDGTGFNGFQRQGRSQDGASAGPAVGPVVGPAVTRNRNRTIQGVIEDALAKVHKHPVILTGSGRTDAGVHAAGQTANFYTDIKNMDAARFVPALNSLLPRDVRIMEARDAAPSFHARFDARRRTYRYHFVCGRPALPSELRYSVQLWRRPRLTLLNDYARLLLGETDCSLFASPQDKSKSRSRWISQAWFFCRGDTLIFEISANAFLWKMVRSIAGTLLFCEERDVPVEKLRGLIDESDHCLAGPTLPPQGLFLWKVDYYKTFKK